MTSVTAHNVRFYKPKVSAIFCMVLNEKSNLLAIGRSDSSIEIWNLKGAPFIERRIPSIVNNCSIEQLCWFKHRLFSVGLDGFLVEYDLPNLTIKHKTVVTAGEIAYCLDVNEKKSRLAVGTEQGYLNIFAVEDEDVSFEKFMDKQEGRILCLKYFPNGKYIASGGIDAIRIWNVSSGQAIHRITTGRSETNKETIIWDLKVTSDGLIISGDSRGRVTFWDGNVGAQVESFQSHKADVLSVCLSKSEKMIYCSGVDPMIVSYEKVNVKSKTEKWVKSIQRKVHDHDVRTLILDGEKLYSGGIDGYLACSYHPPRTLHKFPPLLPNSCISISKNDNLILLQYPTKIEVFRLGKPTQGKEQEGYYKLESKPVKLVRLCRTIKDSEGKEQKEGIICSALSNDGKWIVCGTDTSFRIYKFCSQIKNLLLTSMAEIWKNIPVCLKACFTKDSEYLIIACRSGIIKSINLNSDFNCQTIETDNFLEDTVSFLKVSDCNTYLIISDVKSNIAVFTRNNNFEWNYYCKLPKYTFPPTAIAFHPRKPFVTIVYSDQKIIEYNLVSMKISKDSDLLNSIVSNSWLNKWNIVKNILYEPKVPNFMLFYDDVNIISVKRIKESSEPNNKIQKLTNEYSNNNDVSSNLIVNGNSKYKHLLFLDWLSEGEVVAVEVKPLRLTEQLPPCLKQNLFGTK